MLLQEVATASADVRSTGGRRAKVARLAACLRDAAATGDAHLVAVVFSYLTGVLPQRRTGLGPAALREAPRPSPGSEAALTVEQVDAAFTTAEALTGAGSTTSRRTLLHQLLAHATVQEWQLLAGLVTGELRQGAQEGLLLDALAEAAQVPAPLVRRAVTVAGSASEVAVAALVGDAEALSRFTLRVGTPLGPMLARSAPDVATAVHQVSPAAVEWKLDGSRVQVHRDGDDVRVFTRSLDDITSRVPEVVQAALQLPVRSVVLDGEAIALRPDGRPRPFQQTSARVAVQDATRAEQAVRQWPLTTYLFDVLHLDGDDLTVQPLRLRRQALERFAPPHLVVPHLVVDDGDGASASTRTAQEFADDAIARGHEGVVVKALDAPYEMGRRGAGWVKVKPVHTFDLVVLAAEWGHGRRTGKLSNLHLGALDPDGDHGPPGGHVMLGKTFKGLTDALLAWQTDALLALADGPTDDWVVPVRPELVVEVAIDGVQTSSRYPAGIALRFARVVRYRPDKTAQQADTVATLQALLPR
ncbi:ATP-dependent DNA ligase [Angustibacter sp. Root456]|nr:ATP-dependent DNA ligase [Angustibacter sp. Root456]KQX66456.1 ATP-dependent DNA ligase [Angustibacter sp. Root456]